MAQPRAVVHGVDAGALPESQAVPSITITLKRTAAQQTLLDSFLNDVRTAGATSYHAWLTPSSFAAKFAPAPDAVAAWLQTQGLQVSSVSASGMRITASGTVAQANAAFGVSLHRLSTLTGDAVAVQGTPSVPSALGGLVQAVSGLDAAADALSALEASVDADEATVVSADLKTSAASADELNEVLEQAAAQGQTVVLSNVAHAVLPARALVLRSTADAAVTDADAVTTVRPDWQVAAGLPSDRLRATPDATAADVAAVVAALQTVALKRGRQGEIASRMYAIASEEGVFTHDDSLLPAGSWAAADGLGTIDAAKLVKALAVGATPVLNSQIVLSSRNVTHGQAITLTATITGGSGTPTGTVTFASAQGGTVGSAALVNGVATLSISTLDGGQYGFYGTYNGDSTYSTSTTNVDTATVQPEAAVVTASVSVPGAQNGVTVGILMPVLVQVTSASGVGLPTGTVTVYPYGTLVAQQTYTGTLAAYMGSSSTAYASIRVPASNAGRFTFQANCTTSTSFSCSSPVSFSVTVNKGTPAFTLTQTGGASSATLTATAAVPSGADAATAVPTGTAQFLDGTTVLGSGTLNSSGVATYTGALGSGATHTLTASYAGDGNYTTATATANATTTKVTPTVALTVVTAGSSLSATVTPPAGTTTVPTGRCSSCWGRRRLVRGH